MVYTLLTMNKEKRRYFTPPIAVQNAIDKYSANELVSPPNIILLAVVKFLKEKGYLDKDKKYL